MSAGRSLWGIGVACADGFGVFGVADVDCVLVECGDGGDGLHREDPIGGSGQPADPGEHDGHVGDVFGAGGEYDLFCERPRHCKRRPAALGGGVLHDVGGGADGVGVFGDVEQHCVLVGCGVGGDEVSGEPG